MNALKSIRKYWRIYLLVIITVASLAVIFSPAITGLVGDQQMNQDPIGNEEEAQLTSLRYDIELGGGTRIRAPLVGLTAESAEIGDQNPDQLEEDIASDFDNTTSDDVTVRLAENTDESNQTRIEITTRVPTEETFGQSLENNNVTYNNIREGVTSETRAEAVSILQAKVDQAGLSGGSVRQVELQDGRNLILVEVPDIDRQQTLDLITKRGEVSINIYHYNDTTGQYETEKGVLTREDFRTVGSPQQATDRQPANVPVTLTDEAAGQFANETTRTGVAQVGGSDCRYETSPEDTQPCLLTVVDGEVVYSAGMAPSLADSIRSGSWEDSPNFILQTEDFQEAQQLSINLQAGAPPAPLDIDSGEVSFVAPQQGEQFRIIALLIGIMSTLAVATSVSLRYGKLKVAIPMMVTATAEVVILLAIASLLNYPIDIAVVAGLIAVIGTGVDDLIIISDHVIGGDSPATSTRIFRKRFRRALWIILSAAGTTILALGPIAVLQLRQLQGFAIFTIIGVVAGVLLTRPAYGDMLKYLYTER